MKWTALVVACVLGGSSIGLAQGGDVLGKGGKGGKGGPTQGSGGGGGQVEKGGKGNPQGPSQGAGDKGNGGQGLGKGNPQGPSQGSGDKGNGGQGLGKGNPQGPSQGSGDRGGSGQGLGKGNPQGPSQGSGDKGNGGSLGKGGPQGPWQGSGGTQGSPSWPGQGSPGNGGGQLGKGNPGRGDWQDRDRIEVGGGTWQKTPRNGPASYGSDNNLAKKPSNQPFTIERPTSPNRQGPIEFQVKRQERVERNNNWRVGYYQYNNTWRDDYFCYPYYQFRPVFDQCVMSPWYYYPHLPGYILVNRITIINIHPWSFNGRYYNWQRPYGGGWGNYSDLDYAIDDIVRTFEQRDRRALSRLIPYRSRVNIAVDGQYSYSLNSDDFYDMMLDAMWDTRTYRYNIIDVKTWRDEAQVVAEHQYTDPWGRRSTVYHTYVLVQSRDGWVIRDFCSSAYRWF
jgi:hypothetical protein